ncbi:ATP-binding cassette domain-containing protein [Yinghuangia sp. ASG 101]|uniref:ATP-binding cassette domain-containing protein n=1 Tax=Yinghuangia sp. ASG 101 TaxID=2896848 RepID=UPI001E2CC553|nr:ATP-binding cassette domain-containing protein [Yinghuangia sp. ASG 101]UGQ13034.1 ATP-binding cassette domain-containing protein [Yinghuangia sp. ASG 101]
MTAVTRAPAEAVHDAGRAPAIRAEGLRKHYRDRPALDGFDLTVPSGTVHGLLGPNGAGKTTAVRVLTTLLRADGGHAEVAGHDVARHPAEVRRRIGLVGQHAALDDILDGRANLEMFGRLHHLPRRTARARATELLDRFRLADTGRKPVAAYSGGMRRRLDLAAGMILSPAVIFLDEPTTGLDPASRTEVWECVRSLAEAGTTVLLTTQYLEEADRLADTVTVVDHGRVIARGTPDTLKARLGGDRIDVVVPHDHQLAPAAALLARVCGTDAVETDPRRRRAGAPVRDRVAALTAVAVALRDAGIDADDIALRRPTLDEVFIDLTGHPTGGHTPADPAPAPDAKEES